MRKLAVRELLESFFDGSVEELLRFIGTASEKAVAAAVGEGDSRIDTVLL